MVDWKAKRINVALVVLIMVEVNVTAVWCLVA